MEIFKRSFGLAVVLLLVLGSCTVEKRLHGRGYHVGKPSHWHFSERKELEASYLRSMHTETDVNDVEAEVKADQPVDRDTVPVAKTEMIIDKPERKPGSIAATLIAKPGKAVQGVTQKAASVIKPAAKEQVKQFNQSNAMGKVARGLLIMVAALMLIGLGYIFYIFLGVFGLVLLLIFAIGGIVFFIAGIVVMLFGK